MVAKKGQLRNGQTKEPEYWSWVRMRRRCLQPTHKSYKYYGGRGITIFEGWRDNYQAWLAYVGRKPSPTHTLDRIDSDGNYEPGNVRWADRITQSNNRAFVPKITHKGKTMSAPEWAREIGITRARLKYRLKVLPVEQALDPNVPLQGSRDRKPAIIPESSAA